MSDYENQVASLRDKLTKLNEQAQVIQASADAESRDLTDDELGDINNIMTEFDKVEARIVALGKLSKQTSALTGAADQAVGSNRTTTPQPTQNSGGYEIPQNARIVDTSDPRKGGFMDFGHFAKVVAKSSMRGATVDPRLIRNAPTTYGNESVGADGGFPIPPDFREQIMEKAMNGPNLFSRVDTISTSSNSYVFNTNKYEPWNPSGVTMEWGVEGSQATQQKIQFTQSHLKLHKGRVFLPVTEEQLEDDNGLSTLISTHAPDVIRNALDLAYLQGNGVDQPEGLTNSPAKIAASRAVANKFDFVDASNMIVRLAPEHRNDALWVAHPTVETEIINLDFPGDNSPVIGYSGFDVELPNQRLFGIPIVYSQHCNALGTEGDIFLTSPKGYLAVQKSSGIRSMVDMSLFFDYDISVFKFLVRVGGQTWLRSAIQPRTGTHTLSSVVTLAAA